MADRFVDSAATGGGTGVDWANAYTTLGAAITASTNADTIYVANTHNASQTTAKTWTLPATIGLRIIVVTPSGASGNSGVATGAIEAIGAGSVGFTISGCAYFYGLSIYSATNSSAGSTLSIGQAATPSALYFDNCEVYMRTTSVNTALGINIGPSAATTIDENYIEFRDTKFGFGQTTQNFKFGGAKVRIIGGSFLSASAVPSTLIVAVGSAGGSAIIEASDLSGKAWTNLISAAWAAPYDLLLRNCKLPSGTALTTGTYSGPGGIYVRLENCDSGDTQYNFAYGSYTGTVVDETTIVRSGGGATSQRLDSSANTKFPYSVLMLEGARYNSVVGTAQTLTIEFIHDTSSASGQGSGTSFAYTNAELWVELQYQGTSGFPLALIDIDDRAANVLSTPADQPSSSATWTTTGMTTPVKGKMECTFTAQEAGYLLFKVCFAAPSKVVYVDLLGVTVA